MRCGVVGSPVAHSLSPFLHRRFARTCQRNFSYAAYDPGPSPESFSALARNFFATGGFGLNVTLPFKGAALDFADSASAFAKRARSANTLVRRENPADGVFACNTDGAGLVRDLLRNWNFDPSGKRILLIGAGGAGRGAAHALGDLKPSALAVVNRTAERAAALSREVGAACGIVSLGAALADFGGAFDLVVNATAAGHAGLAPEISPSIFREAALAYDLSYGEAAAPFLDLARRGGAVRATDGLGMLAEQAALSFAVWTGALPSARGILAELRGPGGSANGTNFPNPTPSRPEEPQP